nr:putative pre-mrna-splicing factor atp-dependent rna helicase deah5 [Quercus suber]
MHADYPTYDEEGDGLLYQEEGAEEGLEIEMNEDEPTLLHGKSRYSMDMSLVKNFKNPEGSLSCVAALQSALIKECREEDRMPETGERHLQELRGVGLSTYDMPVWKKDAYGQSLSFGQRSKLSIREQSVFKGTCCLTFERERKM